MKLKDYFSKLGELVEKYPNLDVYQVNEMNVGKVCHSGPRIGFIDDYDEFKDETSEDFNAVVL